LSSLRGIIPSKKKFSFPYLADFSSRIFVVVVGIFGFCEFLFKRSNAIEITFFPTKFVSNKKKISHKRRFFSSQLLN